MIGRAAEQAAAEYLVAAGYIILFRNKRQGHLELDIVARKAGLVAVVEVRSRGGTAFESGLASIDTKKQDRVRRAVALLWGELEKDPTIERVRVDAAIVTFGPAGASVEHIEGAF